MSAERMIAQTQRQTIRLDAYQPHPRNYNRHPAAQVKRIAASLQSFGQVRAVVVWRGYFLAGHGVAEAARSLGWQTLEADALPDDYPEEKALAYLAADNELSRQADPDLAQLAAIIEESRQHDPALLAAIGYDEGEFAKLLRDADIEPKPPKDAEPQTDRAEELRQQWGVVRGQVWRLGEHRLICGDCTDPPTVARVLNGEQADLLLTDPPYCSGGFQESGRAAGSVGTSAVHKKIEADALSTRGYIALIKSMLSAAPTLAAYIFTDWRMWVNLFDAVESSGFGVRQMIAWDKGSPGMGRGWRSQHELIMFALKGVIAFDKFAHAQGNVIRQTRQKNELHATQKPVDLIVTILEVTPQLRSIYDPFAGSGTTLIAAEQTGRRCYCIELDPAYCAVILQRYQDATKNTPTLEEPTP